MDASTPNTSSSAVGTKYEDKFYNSLSTIFDNMPYKVDNCAFHRTKSYPSVLKKGRPINFENVVEVFRTPQDLAAGAQPTLILIFECKNYDKKIGHDEVDELYGRMRHVQGAALKGFIVSKKGFQSGALDTAKSLGIGLIRYLPTGQTIWEVNYQTTVEKVDESARNLDGLTNPDFYSNKGELGFFWDAGVFYFDIAILVCHTICTLQSQTGIKMYR